MYEMYSATLKSSLALLKVVAKATEFDKRRAAIPRHSGLQQA